MNNLCTYLPLFLPFVYTLFCIVIFTFCQEFNNGKTHGFACICIFWWRSSERKGGCGVLCLKRVTFPERHVKRSLVRFGPQQRNIRKIIWSCHLARSAAAFFFFLEWRFAWVAAGLDMWHVLSPTILDLENDQTERIFFQEHILKVS